ncbi:Protein MMF1, mitochondrial AltName: Full=Maintenance of mitochondrial function 1; AltName: Full=Isoleucine biosynthesis and maintenance of intact mitochondria 1; Flags: Precursor [Cyberlindnera jadinii]|uniref:YjgF-like protein n=1 Tax=Cyberlindnera jadinii (strain ATCC 18201 / CBS 1600 / BCRC 20928 / JCM 3617 / NBRC 0987 / NRRL Y-1542) TaxID=983966 RepID=A0A0H5C1H2_CYBJN|nr:Protein MMF1, mitochondrial AltName: Full=Maintenance of mitochondrial function 1; AltName: Full=Isoleucine biosynthesis and maintenance of intact mitochondria 1; Flags: Precursor [Cyberlindnera jadinii]
MSFIQTAARATRFQSKALTFAARNMSTITPIATKNAPPAAASYSQAIKANNFIYVSGQIPYTPEGKPVEGTISDRAEQCIQNVKSILEAAGSGLDKTVKINVFLADMNDFAAFNVVYAKHFNTHKPARSCVAVKALPLGVDVEIEAIAVEN